MPENPFATSKKKYCTFYIVRHGETLWNVEKKIQGQGDSPLTSKGIEQVKITAERLKDIKFDVVYSSDLLRAKKTAEIMLLDRQLTIRTTKLIRERMYGKLEGKPTDLLFQFNKLYDVMNKQQILKHKVDEDAESDEEMIHRFIQFLREAAFSHPFQQILVVTHGGLMRVFLQHIGFWPDNYFSTQRVSNAAYIKLLSDGTDFFVEETEGIKRPDENL